MAIQQERSGVQVLHDKVAQSFATITQSQPLANGKLQHGQIHKDNVVNPGLLYAQALFAAKAPRIADQSPASIAFCTILPLPQALK